MNSPRNMIFDFSISCKTIQGVMAYLRKHDPDCVGLHFRGEGWYQGGGDTLLLITIDGRWELFGWTDRDPRPIFQQLLALENHYG